MRRDEPQCFSIETRPLEALDGPTLLSAHPGRIVSHDPDTGGVTALTTLARGWRDDVDPGDGLLEAFVLDGTLAVDGRPLRSASYLRLPPGGATLEAHDDVRVVVFWHARRRPPEGQREPVVTWAWERPWEHVVFEDFPVGLMTLRLREDDHGGGTEGPTGGWIRLTQAAPGYANRLQERHPGCFEENILLAGDMHMPGRGTMGPGTCLSNPSGHWHGPMGTRTGGLFLVHCDAPMGVELRPATEAMSVELEGHMDTAPWAR